MGKIHLTHEKITKLKYINKDNLKSGTYNFPDFLAIGPQRTGTTWLFKNLQSHPQIFIPPEKELYFFNSLLEVNRTKLFSSDRLEWYSSKFAINIRVFLEKIARDVKTFKKLNISDLNYKEFCSFSLTGEMTASYAAMEECLINEIIILNPDIKIILLIRNPIDRAWSHARKKFSKNAKCSFSEINFKDFVNFYMNDYQVRCGMYSENIMKWSKYVRPENIFIDFFDDIGKNPKYLLTKIFSFLNVSYSEKILNDFKLNKIINPAINEEIPILHKELLLKLFDDEIHRLNKKFNLNW